MDYFSFSEFLKISPMSRYGFYNELIGKLNESEEKKGERKGGRIKERKKT